MQKDNREVVIAGTTQQRIFSCLQVMDRFLNQNEPIVTSMVIAEKKRVGKANNSFEAIMNKLGKLRLDDK